MSVDLDGFPLCNAQKKLKKLVNLGSFYYTFVYF